MIRKTVNLSDEDAAKLAPYFTEGTPEREALAGAVGEEAPLYSDSAILSALAQLGAKALREEKEARGYQEWAANWDAEDQAFLEMADTWAEEAMRDDP